jgi:hypothetical protein
VVALRGAKKRVTPGEARRKSPETLENTCLAGRDFTKPAKNSFTLDR